MNWRAACSGVATWACQNVGTSYLSSSPQVSPLRFVYDESSGIDNLLKWMVRSIECPALASNGR